MLLNFSQNSTSQGITKCYVWGLGSVAGSVIQATGRTDFEDGSRTGTKLEVRNGLQSVRTIPEVNMVSPLGPAMTPGAVWGHNSRIRVEADQSPTCQVPRNQWY